MAEPQSCAVCNNSSTEPCEDCQTQRTKLAWERLNSKHEERIDSYLSLGQEELCRIVQLNNHTDPDKDGCTHPPNSVFPAVDRRHYSLPAKDFDPRGCLMCDELLRRCIGNYEIWGERVSTLKTGAFTTASLAISGPQIVAGPSRGMLAQVPNDVQRRQDLADKQGIRELEWFKKHGLRIPRGGS